MEILLIAMVMSSIVTKWVQDGRTDRSYAAQGMVSPRYQERLARLEQAGRPNTRSVASERGPLRSYLAEVRDDAVLDLGTWLTDRHRKKRDARGPVSFDPTAPTWRQRFTAGMLAEIDDYKRKANWSRPEPEPEQTESESDRPRLSWTSVPGGAVLGGLEYEPGTVTFDEHGEQVPLGPQVTEARERAQQTYPDFYDHVRDPQWQSLRDRMALDDGDDNAGFYDPAHLTGDAEEDALTRHGRCPHPNDADNGYGAPAGLCGAARSPHDDDHPYCAPHAASIRDDRGYGGYVAPGGDVDEHLPIETTNTATTGGTTMTGEAVNYETTIAAIDAAEQQVSTIGERLDGADVAVAELRADAEQISAGMGALRLDDASTAGVNAALEALTPETFADMYARLDAARAGLAAAKENVISTYGDAAATVAVTGVDEAFLATA